MKERISVLILSVLLLFTICPVAYADTASFATGFTNPYGVATDSSGNVYITDVGNNTVTKLNNSGFVYVADTHAHTITKLNGSGAVVSTFSL